MNTLTFTFDAWQAVQLVVAVVLPIIVGLVTRLNASGGLKAVLLAALSVLTSIGTEALAAHNAGTQYDIGQALLLGLGTFAIAVSTHYGLWKPTGVATAAGAVLGGSTVESTATIVGDQEGAVLEDVPADEDDGVTDDSDDGEEPDGVPVDDSTTDAESDAVAAQAQLDTQLAAEGEGDADHKPEH